MRISKGSARFVILIGNLVFKFPRIRNFKQGLKQNKAETLNKDKSKYLTELYFSFPFGFCNIAERVLPLDVADCDLEFIKNYFKNRVSKQELYFLLEDGFLKNFGKRKNGTIVKLDWGGYKQSESK